MLMSSKERKRAEDIVTKHKYDGVYRVALRFMAGNLDAQGLNRLFEVFDREYTVEVMGLQHLLLKCECFTESEVKDDNLETELSDELGKWAEICLKQGAGFNVIIDRLQFMGRVIQKMVSNKCLILHRAHCEPGLRSRVVYTLGEIAGADPTVVASNSDIIKKLIEALARDKMKAVRCNAAGALGNIGKASPTVAMSKRGALIDGLVKALSDDKDSEVRMCAARALSDIGKAGPKVVESNLGALVEALVEKASTDDPGSVDRKEAAVALGEIVKTGPTFAAATSDSALVVSALVKVLADTEARNVMRSGAADALGEIGKSHSTVATGNGGALIDALAKALTGDEDYIYDVRKSAADALGKIGKSHSAVATSNGGALMNALANAAIHDRNSDVCLSAKTALCAIVVADSTVVTSNRGALLKWLVDAATDQRDIWAGSRADDVLREIGRADSKVSRSNRRTLLDTLTEEALVDRKDGEMRWSAAYALGKIVEACPMVADGALVNALLTVVAHDQSSSVREVGFIALRKIVQINPRSADIKDGVPVSMLIECVKEDDDYVVRSCAAHMLGEIGKSNLAIAMSNRGALVAALIQGVTCDKNFVVCNEASNALCHIVKANPLIALCEFDGFRPTLVPHDCGVVVDALVAASTGKISPTIVSRDKTLNDMRSSASQALCAIIETCPKDSKNGAFVEALIKCLTDSNELVRRSAASALGTIGKVYLTVAPRNGGPLINALLKVLIDDGNEKRVRVCAAEALGDIVKAHPQVAMINDGALINDLVKVAIDGKDSWVRRRTARVLGNLVKAHPTVATSNGGALINTLVDILTDNGKSHGVRMDAANEALRWIINAHPEVAVINDGAFIISLANALASDRKSRDVRMHAAMALRDIVRVHPTVATLNSGTLMKALVKTVEGDRDSGVRECAVHALGYVVEFCPTAAKTNGGAHIITLVKAFIGFKCVAVEDDVVQEITIDALGSVVKADPMVVTRKHGDLVGALVNAISEHKISDVRNYAARVLEAIIKADPTVARNKYGALVNAFVKAIATDKDYDVRNEATLALVEIVKANLTVASRDDYLVYALVTVATGDRTSTFEQILSRQPLLTPTINYEKVLQTFARDESSEMQECANRQLWKEISRGRQEATTALADIIRANSTVATKNEGALIKILLQILAHAESLEVQEQAKNQLYQVAVSSGDALRLFIEIVNRTEDPKVHKEAVIALADIVQANPRVGMSNSDALVKTLAEAVTGNEDAPVRRKAAKALADIGKADSTAAESNDGALVEALAKVLAGELKVSVSRDAAGAQKKITRLKPVSQIRLDEKKLSTLVQKLKDFDRDFDKSMGRGIDDTPERMEAAEALGEIGKAYPKVATSNGGALINALIKALAGDKKSNSVRRKAAEALGEIGKAYPIVASRNGGALINALANALTDDEHYWLRVSVARALRGFDLPILLKSISKPLVKGRALQILLSKLLSEAVVARKQSSSELMRNATVTLTSPSRRTSTPIEITQEQFQLLQNIAKKFKK